MQIIKDKNMNLEARKLTIIEKFIHIQNDDIISQIEKILSKVKGIQKKDELKPLTIDEFNIRIKKSMEDSDKGDLISNEELKLEIKKWN